jgi:glucosamine-6-phosphate deaminase
MELSSTVADIIETQIKEHPLSKLGLPTGSTPFGMYDELVNRKLDWKSVITFNLDVYLMNITRPQSYQSYMRKNLFDRTNIYPDNSHFPFRPFSAFENKIVDSKGIDLCILGIGSNGHIAFNEPGSSFDSRTRVVELSEQTREDNLRFFESINDVPKQAITMGLGTIMESKRIILIANGLKKKSILNQAILGVITEDIPASILQKHKNVEVYYCD